ncbi:YecA family protein [Marinobacter sp. X15-166B]|uniref:YecA/YgfB family protein n=1 Tax=Marinobacter sp. X15-166B TaxID=1897620 RepID=UPI00085C3A9B|nr:YecA family protein [Marinobacter sp. X15-166B]OEY67144.1 hypothetical protein BG841_12225 [Marinobacter sp. X15-166B]
MLSSNEIEALEDVLFAAPWGDDALDFFGLHGVVCASVVGPVSQSVDEIFQLATGVEELPASGTPAAFAQAVERLRKHLAGSLDLGQPLQLPEPEDGDPMHALENWCAGFIDAFMEHESEWLTVSEQEIGELLVPMLTLSGLFEDEDFQKVRDSARLSATMADAIPDALTDLYLLYHAPD